jgi:hypothetical protein
VNTGMLQMIVKHNVNGVIPVVLIIDHKFQDMMIVDNFSLLKDKK